jgi:hypothetical protein
VNAFAITAGTEVVVFTFGALVAKPSDLTPTPVTGDTNVKIVI